MAKLPVYTSLNEKSSFFSNGKMDDSGYKIDTKNELDKWFNNFGSFGKEESAKDATALIYRGVTEAKYKLLTSSQRIWISNEMGQWANKNYIDFISSLVKNANKNPLIKKVFDIYDYNETAREFPILSLLQHYGAPTPLMDWTYSTSAAFFFATDGINKKEHTKADDDIDNYFSIYRIDKRKYRSALINVIDWIPDNHYPKINSFKKFRKNIHRPNSNGIFYLSDFERKGDSLMDATMLPPPSVGNRLMIRTQKPITSTFNQNIIPQEGLFIFNPSSKKTLEDLFKATPDEPNHLECFNIHKDLAEYLRRKIDVRFKINKKYIYPSLTEESKKIKESTINELI